MAVRTTAWLAWLLFGVVTLCLVVNTLFAVLNGSGPDPVAPGAMLAGLTFHVAMFSFAVAGVLIAVRQPHNPIGRLLLVIGLVWEVRRRRSCATARSPCREPFRGSSCSPCSPHRDGCPGSG